MRPASFLSLGVRCGVLLGLAALAACSAPPQRVAAPEPARPAADLRYSASFDCTSIDLPWQAYVCRDAELAAQDRTLGALWREQLRTQDITGRAELLASQRHWQRGLAARCQPGEALPAEDTALPTAPLACLKQAWAARAAALRAMPAPRVVDAGAMSNASHPLAAYVAFRSAQSLEPALCNEFTTRLDGLIAQQGRLDPALLPGAQVLAGSHGPAQGRLPDGRSVEVQLHDAGPYGSYELRAQALSVDGTRLLNDLTVPRWITELPNAGGAFGATSSQTGDYAAIDVFTRDQRVWVLVVQTWGYYASAARGESPHAALYERDAQGLQRRCLWRTYTTPPVAQALRLLPQFKALQELLDTAAGPDSMRLAADDRRDAGLLYKEAQWTLLNMPLLAIRETARHGRLPLLRQRHDEALEALFAWSERNVPSKLLYRRVMPLIPASHAELQKAFQGTEGLKPDEARTAADLLLMAALGRAAERLQDAAVARPAVVGNGYRPRYAVAPAPGDLERDRAYSGLHSALLNRAPAEVIDEFMRRTWGGERVADARLGLGPAGDTPLMAAVRSPAAVSRLLAAGADVNGRNDWGKTALMQAAQADQIESVQRLLQAGADTKASTVAWQADGAGGPDTAEGAEPGRTALMYAATSASAATIEALLAAGADRQPIDRRARSACALLPENTRLPEAERTRLRAALCKAP